MNDKKARRTHSEEFKQQIVQLYNIGKSKAEICREYDLAHSLLDRWIQRINSSGSTRERDNRTPEGIELLKLRKENKQLKMENDILKQAALIFAQK
jgi:transposase